MLDIYIQARSQDFVTGGEGGNLVTPLFFSSADLDDSEKWLITKYDIFIFVQTKKKN
jgi:hypothetical protein